MTGDGCWSIVATVLVAGGEAIADIETLRHHDGLLGPVASPATVWRALDEITPAALKRIGAARAKVRRHVWASAAGRAAGVAGGRHRSGRDGRARCRCHVGHRALGEGAGGGELQGRIRIPSARGVVRQHRRTPRDPAAAGERERQPRPRPHRPARRGDRPDPGRRIAAAMLVRADSAGASHQVLDWLTEQDQVRGRSVEYSIGFPIHKGIAVHDAIRTLPESAWTRGVGCRR